MAISISCLLDTRQNSQLNEDMEVASSQQTTRPTRAALVNRRCSAGVKKSLYGRTTILREVEVGACIVAVVVDMIGVKDVSETRDQSNWPQDESMARMIESFRQVLFIR